VCGEKEAAVFIRRSGSASSGAAGSLALCEGCARSRGIVAGKGRLEIRFEELFAVNAPSESDSDSPVVCSYCGTDLASFLRDGRLGCPSCADAFALRLLDRAGRGRPRQSAGSAARRTLRPKAMAPTVSDQLRAAVEAEDYERAAELRDAIASKALAGDAIASKALAGDAIASKALAGDAIASKALAGDAIASKALAGVPEDFPFGYPAFSLGEGAGDSGPEADVVLSTTAVAYRDLEGMPFPGAPRGCSGDYRTLLLERLLALPGWVAADMGSLRSSARRALAERALVPRSYSADPLSPLAACAVDGAYALLGDEDHLRLRVRLPGLAPQRSARLARSIADKLGSGLAFASRQGIGWVCARAEDCGEALAVSATLHLPALAATGLHQRLFRALMAEGLGVRGLYSEEEDSAGAVYEIVAEGRRAGPDAAAALALAVEAAVAAERKARESVAEKGGEARLDLESRSLALASGCRLLPAGEASRMISALRLAALSGRLRGADAQVLGALLERLGAGSLALGAGLAEPPSGEAELSLRAAAARAAVSGAEYLPARIGRCSKA